MDVSGYQPVPAKEKKPRCPECRNKLLLTDIVCRCGIKFCMSHRAPELHACTFDFKKSAQEQLSTMLVKVAGTKVEVI
jgi:predicted nucleic acid binding AN1-type Zn finger protein